MLGCLSDRSTAVNLAVTAQKLSARVAERAKPNEATSGVGRVPDRNLGADKRKRAAGLRGKPLCANPTTLNPKP